MGFFVETRRGLILSLRLPQRIRLCFDPAGGARDPIAEASPELPGAEQASLLRLLQAALDHGDLAQAGILALFAGQDGIVEAIPWLLSLEARASSPEFHRSSGVWAASCSSARLRAQTALVRLNAQFVPSNALRDLKQPRPMSWHLALEELRLGTTSRDIFQAAGAPFFDGTIGDSAVWEYDVVRDGRYHTLRLEFEGDRLRKVDWVEDAFRGTHRDV